MFKHFPSSPFVRWGLLPFSWLYGLAIRLRNAGYSLGLMKSVELDKPVIAIGNITVGGTGKTPFTIAVAQLLIERKLRVGIVSRGYKRLSQQPVVVSNGRGEICPPQLAGDEPYLMAQKLPEAVIIVDADRVRAAKQAVEQFGCQVILADDAFQHRRLGRRLNILLWDPYLNPRKEHLLPAGRLREPFSGVKRADWLVFAKTDHLSNSRARFFMRHNRQLAITTAPLKVESIYQPATGERLPLQFVHQKPVLSFCGLGNHRQFFELVARLSPQKQVEVEFPDHYRYTPADITELLAKAQEHGCAYLITTEKDLANLPLETRRLPQLLVVSIQLELDPLLAKNILQLCQADCS